MDARQRLSNSILRLLGKNQVTLTDTAKNHLTDVLKKYDVNRCGASGGSMVDHVNRFIAAKRVDGLSPKTLKDYSQQLARFADFIQKPSGRVTTDDIREYLTAAYDRGLADSTVGTIINTLKSFYSWLQAEEIIGKNPMIRIKPMRVDKKHLRKALAVEEIEQLRLACASKRETAIFEMFYSSGCRLSELIGLDKNDVNFTDCSLRVVGKGRKERIVFFSARARICLQDYLAARVDGDAALFVSVLRPHRRLKSRTVQKSIGELGKRAGLHSVHPHLLRHSFACFALESGMEITVIQTLLGHDRLDTTQIYAKTSNATVRQAYRKLIF